MKVVFASFLAISLSFGASGCASSTAQVSDFSTIIKTETPVFLSSTELVLCTSELIGVSYFGWGPKSSKCHRDIELMVFAAERIVSKFEALPPPAPFANLVSETIRDLKPIGDSGFSENCTTKGLRAGVSVACWDSLDRIGTDDAWQSLDAWQPYF